MEDKLFLMQHVLSSKITVSSGFRLKVYFFRFVSILTLMFVALELDLKQNEHFILSVVLQLMLLPFISF